MDLIEGK